MTATTRPLRHAFMPRVRPLPFLASDEAVSAAYNNGLDAGERAGYVKGWRNGLGYGLVYGAVAGALGIVATIHLGMLLA